MSETWIIVILTALLGPPFVLWWWKFADRWADAEHKRFKPKAPDPDEQRVVISGFDRSPDRSDARASRSR